MNQVDAAGAAVAALNKFIHYAPPPAPAPQNIPNEAQVQEGRIPPPDERNSVYVEVLTPNGHKARGGEAFVTTRLVFGADDQPTKIRKAVCEQMDVAMSSNFTYTISGDAKSKAEGFTTDAEIKKAVVTLLARNRSARKLWNKAICVVYKGENSANGVTNVAALEGDPVLQKKRMKILEEFRRIHHCVEHPDRFCIVNPNTNLHTAMPQALLNKWTTRVASLQEDPNNFPVWKDFRDWRISVEKWTPPQALQVVPPSAPRARTPAAPTRSPAFVFHPQPSNVSPSASATASTPTVYEASSHTPLSTGQAAFSSGPGVFSQPSHIANTASTSTPSTPKPTLLNYSIPTTPSAHFSSFRSAGQRANAAASSSRPPQSTSDRLEYSMLVKREKMTDAMAIEKAILNDTDSEDRSSDFDILLEEGAKQTKLIPGITILDVLLFAHKQRPDWGIIDLLPAFKLNRMFYVEDLLDTAMTPESLLSMDERVTLPIANYIMSAAQAMRDQEVDRAASSNRTFRSGYPLTATNSRSLRKQAPVSPEPLRDSKRRRTGDAKENEVVVKQEPAEGLLVPKEEHTDTALFFGTQMEPIDISSSDE